jgi:hypothetical protein
VPDVPYRAATNPHKQRRIIVLGIAVVLCLAAFISYAVLTRRETPTAPSERRQSRALSGYENAEHAEDRPAFLTELAPTDDSEAFTRQVAEALFAWNTTTLISRADHVDQLIGIADPTGESTPGLASDLDNYLPTSAAWIELAQYETKQWLTVESVTTPTLWAEAEQQAGADGLMPGTTAFTIRGVRHRSGVWEGEPVTSAHDVTFTVFIVCAPSFPRCHLLRLSMLDNPLD